MLKRYKLGIKATKEGLIKEMFIIHHFNSVNINLRADTAKGAKSVNRIALVQYACNMYDRFILIEYKCIPPATKRLMERPVKH